MKIEWKKSESTIRPKEVDYESSLSSVYVRKNIKTEIREELESQETTLYYIYDEAVLTPEEYTVYAAEQAHDENLAIMSALADIYDQIGE